MIFFYSLLQVLFAIDLVRAATATVSCYFSFYNSVEFKCTISSVNTLSENDQLVSLDYEDYRPYLTSLFSSESEISHIPTGFFKLFYNAKSVYFASSHLKQVTKNSFRNGFNILTINLYNNELTSLPADAFSDCQSLTQLYLDHNKLSVFDVQPGLPKLTELVLSYNKINARNPEVFQKLPQLVRLDLGGNICTSSNFRKINAQTLENIAKFELVTCSFNWKNMVVTTPAPPSMPTSSRECKFPNHPTYGYTCTGSSRFQWRLFR